MSTMKTNVMIHSEDSPPEIEVRSLPEFDTQVIDIVTEKCTVHIFFSPEGLKRVKEQLVEILNG